MKEVSVKSHHVYSIIGNAWLMSSMAITAFDGQDVQAVCSAIVGLVWLFCGDKVRRSAE